MTKDHTTSIRRVQSIKLDLKSAVRCIRANRGRTAQYFTTVTLGHPDLELLPRCIRHTDKSLHLFTVEHRRFITNRKASFRQPTLAPYFCAERNKLAEMCRPFNRRGVEPHFTGSLIVVDRGMTTISLCLKKIAGAPPRALKIIEAAFDCCSEWPCHTVILSSAFIVSRSGPFWMLGIVD